jgi:hypothetical protein
VDFPQGVPGGFASAFLQRLEKPSFPGLLWQDFHGQTPDAKKPLASGAKAVLVSSSRRFAIGVPGFGGWRIKLTGSTYRFYLSLYGSHTLVVDDLVLGGSSIIYVLGFDWFGQ